MTDPPPSQLSRLVRPCNESTLWYGSGKSILFISLNFLMSYFIKNLVLFSIVDVPDTGFMTSPETNTKNIHVLNISVGRVSDD